MFSNYGLFNDSNSNVEKDILIDVIFELPINWVGNKKKIIEPISQSIEKHQVSAIFDVFAGSGVVSSVSSLKADIYCNDLLTTSTTWLLPFLSFQKNPLNVEEFKELRDSVINPKATGSLDFLKTLYEGSILSVEEVVILESYKQKIIDVCGRYLSIGHKIKENTLKPAFLDMLSNEVVFENQICDESFVDKAYKTTFAMQMMCVHILQQAFMGGRCFKSQLLASHSMRMKRNENTYYGESSDIIGCADKFLPLIKPPRSVFDKLQEVFKNKQSVCLINEEAESILKSGLVKADLLYVDPPYGGHNSDYAWMYRICEEFLTGKLLDNNEVLREQSVKFKGSDYEQDKVFRYKKRNTYIENFTSFLSACENYPIIVISYNESSFLNLKDVVGFLSDFGRNTHVEEISYKYNYRKQSSRQEKEFIITAS